MPPRFVHPLRGLWRERGIRAARGRDRVEHALVERLRSPPVSHPAAVPIRGAGAARLVDALEARLRAERPHQRQA